MTPKNHLRKQLLVRRPDFPTLEQLSPAVFRTLLNLECFQTARSIGAYIPLPDEVDISPLFQRPDLQLYIPAFDPGHASYRMAKWAPDLIRGKFGIPEPENPIWAGSDELDLILVPGMAFDFSGNRLGRGGGFYDRLLPHYTALRIGVGFDFQCVGPIDTEPHDCRLDFLITESRCLEFMPNC